MHIYISRRAIGASAREGKAGGRGDEDGDETGEKNEAEGKWSDAHGSRIRRGEKIKRNWRRLRTGERQRERDRERDAAGGKEGGDDGSAEGRKERKVGIVWRRNL